MFKIHFQLIISGSLTLATGYFIYTTLKIYKLRKKYKHIPGPPANGILGFYMGNIVEIRNAKKRNVKLEDKLVEWIHKYGTTIKFQILDQIIVFTADLTAIREILIEKNFPQLPSIYEIATHPCHKRFLSQYHIHDIGRFKWKSRALFNPALHKQVLYGFMNKFNCKGDLLLEKLKAKANGNTEIKLLDEFNHATLDIIGTDAFGIDSKTINKEETKLNCFMSSEFRIFETFFSEKLILSIPFSDYLYKKEYAKIIRTLRTLGREQIESRLKQINQNSNVPNDLLTITLRSYEEEAFDIEDMIEDFINFFISGQDTTASTLSFCFLELARNSSVFQKLREEIDELFSNKESIEYEDLVELKYTSAVIKETLRLWPVEPVLNRIVPNDYYIKNILIPKDTWIQTSSFVNARLEEYYKHHAEFRPERFLNSGEKSSLYFPAVNIQKSRMGLNFAQIEMKILIAKLIRNFDFELVPGQDLSVAYSQLRPINEAKCYLHPRKF